jgi:hypothetical protein
MDHWCCYQSMLQMHGGTATLIYSGRIQPSTSWDTKRVWGYQALASDSSSILQVHRSWWWCLHPVPVTCWVEWAHHRLLVSAVHPANTPVPQIAKRVRFPNWTHTKVVCDSSFHPTLQKGCQISISYGIFLRAFGPSISNPDPLINPSDDFLDLVAPILNLFCGRQIVFYLSYDYAVNPSDSLAESLVPHVRFLMSPPIVIYWTFLFTAEGRRLSPLSLHQVIQA